MIILIIDSRYRYHYHDNHFNSTTTITQRIPPIIAIPSLQWRLSNYLSTITDICDIYWQVGTYNCLALFSNMICRAFTKNQGHVSIKQCSICACTFLANVDIYIEHIITLICHTHIVDARVSRIHCSTMLTRRLEIMLYNFRRIVQYIWDYWSENNRRDETFGIHPWVPSDQHTKSPQTSHASVYR